MEEWVEGRGFGWEGELIGRGGWERGWWRWNGWGGGREGRGRRRRGMRGRGMGRMRGKEGGSLTMDGVGGRTMRVKRTADR
ncbi:hypothetical protein, partial [Prescottella equi]|uniref:hypothetical protein n=1 Tax=Rhodococcus hoagii TaxID=43767 RepID=UPI001C92F280